MQFVPANKLSSHREKVGCPLVAKSSSDGEFSSGEENRSRADNNFFVRIFLRVRNEERGNYFKGWSWTIEIRFFLFSSFAATVVRRKQNLCNFIDLEVEKDQLKLRWTKQGPWCDVTCPTFVRFADDKKSVCVVCMKHLPKPSKAETKIQIKSLYTFILYFSPYNQFV